MIPVSCVKARAPAGDLVDVGHIETSAAEIESLGPSRAELRVTSDGKAATCTVSQPIPAMDAPAWAAVVSISSAWFRVTLNLLSKDRVSPLHILQLFEQIEAREVRILLEEPLAMYKSAEGLTGDAIVR